MSQKGLTPILIVLILAGLVGGYFVYQNQTKPAPAIKTTVTSSNPDTTPSSTISPYSSCFYKGSKFEAQPFKREAYTVDGGTYYKASGIVNVKGQIVMLPVKWYEIETKAVFIKVKPSDKQSKELYDEYIYEIEKGNGINKKDGSNLLFKLGEMKEGSFITSASLSSTVKNDIEKSLKSGETLELSLSIDIPVGHGALPNFSFACAIEKS